MATTINKDGNLVETIIDAQTKLVNEIAETAKNMTKNMPIVGETIEKGKTAFAEATEASKKAIKDITENINKSSEEANKKTEENKNFFLNWLENQMTAAKNVYQSNTTAGENTDNQWTNWTNQWMNGMNNMNNMNTMNSYFQPFQNLMNQQQNPFNTNPNEMMNTWSNFMKQYMETATNGMNASGMKFDESTITDSMKGLNNMTESTMKFYEMWLPMMKDLQNNTFSKEVFAQSFDTAKYKEFMDKFFGFMPDNVKQMADQMNKQYTDSMKQFSTQGMGFYNQMKGQMNQNPFMNQMNQNPFNNMWENYSKMNQSLNESMSPFTKLMADNPAFKNVTAGNEFMQKLAEFNIKNNQLQYMMYEKGNQVMEKMVEKMATKTQNGESIDSLMKVYQDWMTTGDEIYTDFFKSDEYSKLMTEVSSLQMKLKMDVEKQIESTILKDMPVATRSEMDEVYKNLYDLKKMYRRLEKLIYAEEEEIVKEEAPKATKTTKKK